MFENYKTLEATQLENEEDYIEKNKINIDAIIENHNEYIKNNKSILKTLQRFKSQKLSEDLLSEKEEINCNNIIKWFKKWLFLTMLQKNKRT